MDYNRGYSLEEWQAVISGYSDAFVFAAGMWVPGMWALVGALALPVLAVAGHALFPNRFKALRILFAPLAGGFAGGFFYAVYLQSQTCRDFTGPLCIIQSPPQELANIILGGMLCVVFVYLALPGKKIPRRLFRPGHGDVADAFDIGD